MGGGGVSAGFYSENVSGGHEGQLRIHIERVRSEPQESPI